MEHMRSIPNPLDKSLPSCLSNTWTALQNASDARRPLTKGDLANIKRGDSISESDCDCEPMEKV